MGDTLLDHPGEISWFKGYGPAAILGPCPHTSCPHNVVSDIAWGPDFDHYTLVACEVSDGCKGWCRGWMAEYPHNDPRPRYSKPGPFLLTDTSERALHHG